MYRKKLVAAVLVALMASSAVACQRDTKKNKKDKDEEETTVEVTETEATTEETTEATTEATTEETTEATTEATEPEIDQQAMLSEELKKICEKEGVCRIGSFDNSVFEQQDNEVGGAKYYQKCTYSDKGVLFARIDEYFGDDEYGMLVVLNTDEGVIATLYGFYADKPEVTEFGRVLLDVKLDDIRVGTQGDPWFVCNRQAYIFKIEEEEDGFVLLVYEKLLGYDTDFQKILIYAIGDQGITIKGGVSGDAHIFVGGEIPGEDCGLSLREFDENGEPSGDWHKLGWSEGPKFFNDALENRGVKNYHMGDDFKKSHDENRGESYFMIPREEADFIIEVTSEHENVECMMEVDAPKLDIKDQSKDNKLYDSWRNSPVADAGETTEPTEPTETTAEQPGFVTAAIPPFAECEALYAPVLSSLSSVLNSGERYLDEVPAEFTFGSECPNGIFFEDENYSYWFDDLDADGTPELFIGDFMFDENMNPKTNLVNYLVTKTDTGYKFVAQGWLRSWLAYVGNGYFSHEGSGGAALHYQTVFHYDGESKELITDCMLVTEYQGNGDMDLSAYVEGVKPTSGSYKDDPNALHGDDAQAKWDEAYNHIKDLPMPWLDVETKSIREYQAPIA